MLIINKVNPSFLPVSSGLAGVLLAIYLFFGQWGIISELLYMVDPQLNTGLVREFLWTVNFALPFFIIGRYILPSLIKDAPKKYLFYSLPIVIPITALLYLFAGIPDAPYKEYMPRIIWVFLPAVTYLVTLFYTASRMPDSFQN